MVADLFLAVIFSAGLFVILRAFHSWKINSLHGIIFNYWTAASVSIFMMDDKHHVTWKMVQPFLHIALFTGVLFILVFFLTGITAKVSGVAVTSIASKMSMVIPITAGFIFYNESMGLFKITGILLAIPAVIMASMPSKGTGQRSEGLRGILLPVLLFAGAGLVDTIIKYLQHHYMDQSNMHLVIMMIFASAGLTGTIKMLYDLAKGSTTFRLRSIPGGMLLGISNYLSLYYLLKCLDAPGSESSTVFAFVNTGVVITSFGAGMFLFNEKASSIKIGGLILAIIAIIILSR